MFCLGTVYKSLHDFVSLSFRESITNISLYVCRCFVDSTLVGHYCEAMQNLLGYLGGIGLVTLM